MTFFPFFLGETEKPCTLILVDDTEHEEEEELRLVLGSPKSESPFGASVGGQNETLLKIKDDADSKSTVFKSVSCYQSITNPGLQPGSIFFFDSLITLHISFVSC